MITDKTDRLVWVLLAVIGALAVGIVGYVIGIYRNAFAHPHFFGIIMSIADVDRQPFGWHDLINSFNYYTPDEHRPRFLAYVISSIDLRVRHWLYRFLVVPPAASVSWLFTLLLGPWWLYRLMVNLTRDRLAAVTAVIVYVTSIGFLSGFAMLLIPGKPLSNVVFIAALYLGSQMVRQDPRIDLVDGPVLTKYVLLSVMFTGAFLDEVPLFVFVLLPLLFKELFYRREASVRGVVRNAGFFMIPLVAFLVFVVSITPVITNRFLHYRFDYLGTIVVRSPQSGGLQSLAAGPYGAFGWQSLYENFTTLFGVSLVPWQISSLTVSPLGDFYGGQINNWPKLVVLFGFAVGVGILAKQSHDDIGRSLRRHLVATLLFVVFLSVLSGRHVPVVTGYYYGSAFAVFFALVIGLSSAVLRTYGGKYRLAPVVLLPAIVFAQTDNFQRINAKYVELHNERMTRAEYQGKFQLADRRDVTREELGAIRRAWAQGRLASYLEGHVISAGAIYLVVELQAVDGGRSGDRTAR